MQRKTFKTHVPTAQSKTDKQWFLVDADGKTLGHLATVLADIIRGKNKPTFAHHMDMGDHVIVINADKIRLSGRKESQKEYITHSGYLGNLKRKPIARVRKENPTRILLEAVSGMLPKNRLRRPVLEKLHVHAGPQHPHAGQQPISLTI